jgi:chromate transporter
LTHSVTEADRRAVAPSSTVLFLTFARIGLTSFGGGLSGWMLREFVQARGWLGEDEFLSGLALAQAFPGVNVVNLAIWIGYRLRGTRGALAGFGGIVVPSAVLVVVIGAGFAALARFPLTHLVLDGMGAAAIGLSLQMGLLAGRRAIAKGVWPAILMLLAFVAVGLLQLSLPLVVVVLGVVGVALAYRDLSRA